MAILVSNAEESSGETCDGGCPTWRLHWENRTGRDAEYCSAVDCDETEDLVGGHVYIVDDDDDECYIIPICRRHNYIEMGDYYVDDDTEFVPDYEHPHCTQDFEYDDEE